MMTYNELKQNVSWGEEYNFYFKGKEYWISNNDKGYYLSQNSENYQEFSTSEELFLYAKIEGKHLEEIWNEIKEWF